MGNGDYVHDYASLLNYAYMTYRFIYILRRNVFCGITAEQFESTLFRNREAMRRILPPKGFEKYEEFSGVSATEAVV